MLPQPEGLLKLTLNLFCRIIFKEENSTDMMLCNTPLTLASMWMGSGKLLRVVGLTNHELILSGPIIIQGRDASSGDLIK